MKQFCDLSNLRIETDENELDLGIKNRFFHADIEWNIPTELRIRWNIKEDGCVVIYVQTAIKDRFGPHSVVISDPIIISNWNRFINNFCAFYSKLFQMNPFHYMQKEEIEKIIQLVKYFDVNHLDISNLNLSMPKFINGEKQ